MAEADLLIEKLVLSQLVRNATVFVRITEWRSMGLCASEYRFYNNQKEPFRHRET